MSTVATLLSLEEKDIERSGASMGKTVGSSNSVRLVARDTLEEGKEIEDTWPSMGVNELSGEDGELLWEESAESGPEEDEAGLKEQEPSKRERKQKKEGRCFISSGIVQDCGGFS